jgi:hypothetical protein
MLIFLLAAVIALGSAAFAARPGASSSRRLLAATLALLIPGAGIVLGELVRRTRGGALALEPDDDQLTPRLSTIDVARLGEMPPVLDRLLCGDQAERMEALVALSSAGDAAAVAILRWAIEHGPPEVVLEAALTLEEIDLRSEARRAAMVVALEGNDLEHIIAAGDAAAGVVLSRIADPAIVPLVAEEARTFYHRALELAPDRALELEEKLARLELASGRARVALALVDRVRFREGADQAALAILRDDAAFAAREFGALSFLPVPLDPPAELSARALQTLLT